jgi:hypothetical protein
MKILVIIPNEGGVEYHRLIKPFTLLADQGHEVNSVNLLNHSNFDVLENGYDYVVFSRILCIEEIDISIDVLNAVRKSGAKVIVDVDDYWKLHHGHLLERHWRMMKYDARTEFALKNADMVWTTHKHLAAKVDNFNTHVIPNAIDPTEAQWQPSKVDDYSIGWFGSAAHEGDVKTIAGQFRNWSKNNKDVKVYSTYNESQAKIFMRIAHSLGECNLVPSKSVYEYGNMYDLVSVSIAPLSDNSFNACKSELKAIEAGFKGKAFIATKMHPYTICCDVNNSVLFRPSNLIAGLNKMKDEAFREDKAAALSEMVRANYDLRTVNKLREQLL